MNIFTLNGKEYKAKVFDFNLICDLEDQGVHMDQAANKPLSMMRAYFGICAGLDRDQAGKEIASHMEKGGTMDELGEAMGNELRRKMHDYEMWLMGGYVIEAIMSSIGNSQWFRGKHGKIHYYPQKPMLEQAMENSGPMSERELRRQRELFVARLQVMKTNFELSKRKNRDDSAS